MKRIITLLASAALVASGLSIVPASAGEAPNIPDVVQIEDPLNDGNFLNDQGNRGDIGFQGDHVTPADASTVGDLMKIWFTNDKENVSVHIQTQAPGPAATTIVYQVYTNAGEGSVGSNKLGCLRWYGLIPGAYSGQPTTYQGEPLIKLIDRCNDGTNAYRNGVEGKFEIAGGPDGSGILTMTFPRSYSPFLSGPALTVPFASSSLAAGADGAGNASPLMIDNTADGADYTFIEGDAGKPVPPGKNDPPGKKKGCTKGKGKKRGCEGKGKKSPKPGKPSSACAAFTPGEAGKDKPTVTLTDAATEDKPVEQTVTLGQSTADVKGDPTYDHFNVIVDAKAAEAGLYATFEFPTARDYDIDLLHTDGSYAARSHGFNPIGPLYSTPLYAGREGHGGKTTANSESLVGIKTSDCGGWTIETVNWLGEGGEFTVKLWLGEAQIDPQEEGAEKP